MNNQRIVLEDDDDEGIPENVQVIETTPQRPSRREKKPEASPEEEVEEEEEVEPTPCCSTLGCTIIIVVVGIVFVGTAYLAAVRLLGVTSTVHHFAAFSNGFKDTTSEYALVNSTTPELLWQVKMSLQVEQPLRWPCLCMHHLQLNTSMVQVRVCNVYNPSANQHYFMVNPRLIGSLRADQVDKRELSISCREPKDRLNKRFRAVFIEWEDEKSQTHYALFREAPAYCLQLALDEFQGPSGPQCLN